MVSSHSTCDRSEAVLTKLIIGSPTWIMLERVSGIPTSREMRAAMSSVLATMPSEIRERVFALSSTAVVDQL